MMRKVAIATALELVGAEPKTVCVKLSSDGLENYR